MTTRTWRAALVVMLVSAVLPLVHGAQPARALSCQAGGPCKLGDKGPLGGVVFFVASTPQWWGQYMESFTFINAEMRKARPGGSVWLTPGAVYQGTDAKARRIEAKQIGAGAENFVSIYGLVPRGPFLGVTWIPTYQLFHPSKDELDALYNYIATTDSPLDTAFRTGVVGDPYWSSTEASDTFAWYQLFNDGTQFTDANGIVNGLKGNKTLTKSSMHKGSAFPSKTMRHIFIGAWAPNGAVLPPKPPRPVIPAGGRASVDCATWRRCQVGDIGPGGGLVFYDAGSTQPWGRYLEAAPASCQKSGLTWRIALPGKRGTKQLPMLYPTWATAARQRVESKRLGMGQVNTALVIKQHKGLPQSSLDATAAGYANSLVCGGKDDWFLPSKDELDTLYNVLAVTDNDLTGNNSFGFTRGFYWTSSEYNNETAWTQLWVDGQQFDREKWMSGDQRKDGGFNPFHVRPIRAFG
ncbi:MAG: hypothetical protein ACO30L_06045 [Ilumatobacteraceae bacterium]